MNPALASIISAVIAGVVAFAVARGNAKAEARRQERQLAASLEQSDRAHTHALHEQGQRLEVELRNALQQQRDRIEGEFLHALKLQEERLKVELRTQFMAERAIEELLREAEPLRSFERIRDRIGGFKDEELRQLLVRSGALRYWSKDGHRRELWGLRDRTAASRTGDSEPTQT